MLTSLARRLADNGVLDVLDRFHRDLSGLAQDAYAEGQDMWQPGGLEVWEDEHNIYVEAELPGVKAEDVDVTLEGGTLTIRGQKKQASDQKNAQYHYRQRRYGQFMQQFTLPTTVDSSKVTAKITDGILRVQVEKRPEVKPRKIDVKAS
jgi:HSP20 family protein